MKKIAAVFLVGLLLMVGAAPTLAQQPDTNFVDIEGHWAESDIMDVSSLGLLSGIDSKQGGSVFAPDARVTRAELASVLVRTFALDYGQIRFVKQPLISDYYRDVDNHSWYANAALVCAVNDIFNLDNDFEPKQEMSRIEVAQAVKRSFEAKEIVVPMILMMPVYEDTNDLEQEEQNAMVFVSNTGIMEGTNNCFRPHDTVTRAELARIINRCIEMMTIDENMNGKEYRITPGQPFVLALPSNPSTGYQWTITSIDKNALILLDESYQTDKNDNKLVGQNGYQYWRFKAAQQEKTAELKLHYARPWESKQPAETFALNIIIDSSQDPNNEPIVTTAVLKKLSEHMDVDLQIPVINGLPDKAIQNQINTSLENEAIEFKVKLTEDLDAYVKECKQMGYPVRPYAAVSRYQTCYSNTNFLSLYVDYYQYTGGAHGMTDRCAYNLDLRTGEKIALSDLFPENINYKAIINQKIEKQIQSEPENYFTGEDMGFNSITEDQGYYIQDGQLVIYFDLYEIAPYAAGFPEFKIPLTELQQAGLKTELIQ